MPDAARRMPALSGSRRSNPNAALPRPPAVAGVIRQVTATARRHRMFLPGEMVVVAVSGGPDSVCLLHTLVRVRRLFRIRLACFHFDHRLRDGSDRDARSVRRRADQLGLPFVLRRADSRPARGESVEAWARTVRYRALHAVIEELGGGVAAVGHTADDQAETLLLALLRGGGIESLSAMAPVRRPIVRPLLDVTREQTHAFCRSLNLRPRRDPMNEDPALMRAALRGRFLPELERAAGGRGIRGPILRTAELLREDAEFLDRLSREAESTVLAREGEELLLRADPLAALARPLASRIARRALLDAGELPEVAHVEALLDLAAGRPGRRASLPSGLLARRDREYVRLFRPSPPGGERPPGDRRPAGGRGV